MILAALLLAMAALPAFSAEKQPAKGRPQRFAVVNLEKVFQEYYKSRIAEDAIKQQAEVFRNSMMRLNEELRTLKEEAPVPPGSIWTTSPFPKPHGPKAAKTPRRKPGRSRNKKPISSFI
ncbi:OmpH family outer membrane protein [Victivallis vadensis]|uniref:OmpH family outer membrane protein n=1 Tax=Victivallis vadensis TaxID=172901 RepID=UPI00164CFAD3|nr:OmpH family outer membrane protein [Victivallis vadensis]